jgi:hypothetical protein
MVGAILVPAGGLRSSSGLLLAWRRFDACHTTVGTHWERFAIG